MTLRNRVLLLLAVPVLAASALAAFAAFAIAAGAAWIYVFGDQPWPGWSSAALIGIGLLAFVVCVVALSGAAWRTALRAEQLGRLPIRTVGTAWAACVVVLAVVYARQATINPPEGPITDGARCADWCGAQGYAASGTSRRDRPPVVCSCLNGQGREAVTTPAASISQVHRCSKVAPTQTPC